MMVLYSFGVLRSRDTVSILVTNTKIKTEHSDSTVVRTYPYKQRPRIPYRTTGPTLKTFNKKVPVLKYVYHLAVHGPLLGEWRVKESESRQVIEMKKRAC